MTRRLGQETAKAARMAIVVSMYLKAQPVEVAAKKAKCGVATAYRYLAEARERWLADAKDSIAAHVARQLGRIDHLEREAWEAWEASKGPELITTKETEEQAPAEGETARPKTKTGKRTRPRLPEARYADTVQWCIAERSKLLGLYKPTKVAQTTPDGSKSWEPDEQFWDAMRALPREQREALRALRTTMMTLQGTAKVVGSPDDQPATE